MTNRDVGAHWLSDRVGLSMLLVVSGAFATLIVITQLPYVLLAIVLAYLLNSPSGVSNST